ncbi:MAG: hypothetical protein LBD16_07460 [Oscillospiraceae bacterium]|jgi:hypothetical protein|nr:hypothetical protein [Oscillospiraceae bacterium]
MQLSKHKTEISSVLLAVIAVLLILPTFLIPPLIRNRDGEPVSARALLDAAKESGMNATAFYLSGTVTVRREEESAAVNAARRILLGVTNAEVSSTANGELAAITISVSCEPSAWSASQAMHQIQSALGRRADITLCLVGSKRGNSSSESVSTDVSIETAAQILAALGDSPIRIANDVSGEQYVSVSGRASQVATVPRSGADDEIYIGSPYIPLDY